MTAAFQPRTNGPAHWGQSRFFASPSRTQRHGPRHRHSRPANRRADRKTAPGIFLAPAPKTHRETPSQSLGTYQESTTYVFVFASGCAVAPNSAGSSNPYASIGATVGGTALIPSAFGVLSGGGNISGSASVTSNGTQSGTFFQLSFSFTPLVGLGGTFNGGVGSTGGLSYNAPQLGFSYEQANYVEVGAGVADVTSLSLNWNSNGVSGSPPLTFGGFRENAGAGLYGAWGRSNTITLTLDVPNFTADQMQLIMAGPGHP